MIFSGIVVLLYCGKTYTFSGTGFLGCCGTLNENGCLLKMVAVNLQLLIHQLWSINDLECLVLFSICACYFGRSWIGYGGFSTPG